MPIDYLATFPVPHHLLPEKLRRLLSPIGLDPQERVEVSALSEEKDASGIRDEAVHLVMAAVPEPQTYALMLGGLAALGFVARRRRKAARQHDTRKDAANQAGTCRHRDAVKITKADARLFKGQLDNPIQPFRMSAGSDFGNNATKRLVQVGLAQNFRRQNLGCKTGMHAHHGGGGIVATRFDAKKGQCPVHGRRCRKGQAQVTPWAWRNNPWPVRFPCF